MILSQARLPIPPLRLFTGKGPQKSGLIDAFASAARSFFKIFSDLTILLHLMCNVVASYLPSRYLALVFPASGIRVYHSQQVQSLWASLLLAVYIAGAVGLDVIHHTCHDHTQSPRHTVVTDIDSPRDAAMLQPDTGACQYANIIFCSAPFVTPEHFVLPRPVQITCIPSTYRPCVTDQRHDQFFLRGPPAV